MCASGLVVKFNVAIVEPRVRFSAGAVFSPPFFCILKAPRHIYAFILVDRCSWNAQGSFLSLKAAFDTTKSYVFSFGGLSANVSQSVGRSVGRSGGGTFVIRRRAQLAFCYCMHAIDRLRWTSVRHTVNSRYLHQLFFFRLQN